MSKIKAIINHDSQWTLNGVDGFGYYAMALNPSNIFSTKEDAEAAAVAARTAFEAGKASSRREIRLALGVEDE